MSLLELLSFILKLRKYNNSYGWDEVFDDIELFIKSFIIQIYRIYKLLVGVVLL